MAVSVAKISTDDSAPFLGVDRSLTNRRWTVRDADLIVVMESGRIVEAGTHDALIARGGAYARMQRLQVLDDIPPAA